MPRARNGNGNGNQDGVALTLDGQLMAFRTTWLRAVATIWSEIEGSKEPKEPSKSGLYRDLTKDKLTRDPASLAAAAKANSAGKALGKRFPPFTWPWDHMSLAVRRSRETKNHLRWAGDDWVWCADEGDFLLLYLPLRPRLDPGVRARALADYYASRPSIFGKSVGGGGATPRGTSLVNGAAIDVADHTSLSISDYLLSSSPVRFGGKNPPNGGFVGGSGSFLDLEVVLVSALAKAWESDNFADLLDSTKADVTLNTDPAVSAATAAALATIRGYAIPWKLEVRLANDPTIRYNKDKGEWENPTRHLLALNFPEKPQSIGEASVALASYNSTGAEFPFTCCA